MLDLLQNANLVLRLGVELALLVAVGHAAWRGIRPRAVRAVAAVSLPTTVAVLWATVVHGATVPAPVQLAAQAVLFGTGVAGLVAVHRGRLAACFTAVIVVNAALMGLLAQ
jgi:hypothetical protein